MADCPDVIKFDDNGQLDGGQQLIVYKHPSEDFCTGTQLIVHESQEAIFFLDGRAMDTFPPGKHTLETQNLPLLGKIFGFGKESTPFHCSVYFINRIGHIARKWGTSEGNIIEYMDPVYNFPLQLAARGEIQFSVEESRRLLMKLVGTRALLTNGEFYKVVKDMLLMRFKNYMASLMIENKICIFQIDQYLEAISSALYDVLKSDFSEFGVCLERFIVVGFQKPEDDANYRHFKELFYRQYVDVTEARLRQQVKAIEAEGQDGAIAAGKNVCADCGAELSANAKFCPHCGKPQSGNVQLPQVECPSCGVKVHLTAFCENCGMPFYTECPSCRARIQVESNFCPKCGVRISR